MEFGSTIEADGGATVLVLHGDLDITSAPVFEATMFGLIGAGHHDLVVDLAALEFLESTGLTVLVRAHKQLATCGGTLTLRHPRPMARKVLETTGITTVIAVEVDDDDQ